jgi:peptide/nickel transport system substrate-binding protein
VNLAKPAHLNMALLKKLAALAALGTALALLLLPTSTVFAQEISWSLKYDPRTFDPALVDDQASEMVRFLTGGVLLRVNRVTQQVEPALASSWTISPDGKLITFHLRDHLRFSDGSALTSADVVSTLQRNLNPATQAPVAEEFLDAKSVTVDAPDPLTVRVHLSKRVVGIGKFFDEIAIEPANHPSQERVTAGSFFVADYKQGEFVRLARNPNYWRHDAKGVQLPYLASVKLDILANRDQDELRFVRGQYQLIESVPAENFSVLAQKAPRAVHDLGPSLNTEQMWFNQSPAAPIPAFEKAWFTSRNFRNAISMAIKRADLARIAYDGHATPANGFVSPANKIWYNQSLPPAQENINAALTALAKDGFRKDGATLVDRDGHPVSFSLLTNAGNHAREKMASLLQQDLAAIGIKLNVVTLDFPALIDRLMHTQNYEAALLGLSNVEPDPSSMMNVWLSSSPNHQWNPSEKSPATPWEAELDRLMNAQAVAATDAERKRSVDRVQQIVAEQQPFIYLVYPNALYAVSPSLSNAYLTVLQPGIVSNIDFIKLGAR